MIVNHETPNSRKKPRKWNDIKICLIHYTNSMNGQGTLSWFKNRKSRVSAHYVIDLDGTIHSFNKESNVLWHAGKSSWKELDGLNRYSIGYEMVGTYDSGFTDAAMNSLVRLLNIANAIYDINAIIGHEQVSPGRKFDPGPKFPWERIMDEWHWKWSESSNLDQIGYNNLNPPKPSDEDMGPGAKFVMSSPRLTKYLGWLSRRETDA